jgi:hypothetical protein
MAPRATTLPLTLGLSCTNRFNRSLTVAVQKADIEARP